MNRYHPSMYPNGIEQSTSPYLTLDDLAVPRLPPPATPRERRHRRTTTFDTTSSAVRSDSHSPARSATYLPFFHSRSSSPTRSIPCTLDEAGEHAVDSTNTSSRTQKPVDRIEKIASWFEGTSEPITFGFVASPKREETDPFYMVEAPKVFFSPSQNSSSVLPPSTPAQKFVMSHTSSRFGFFSRKTASTTTIADPIPSLDISASLFPHGQPDDITPESYKALQNNAETAIRTLHTAYSDSAMQLKRSTSERNIQSDELEAAGTRTEHLKAQLLEIASRAADQDKLIQTLRAELELTKTRAAAAETIRVIEDHTGLEHYASRPGFSRTCSMTSSVSSIDVTKSVFSDEMETRSTGTSVGCPSPVMKHANRVVAPVVQIPSSGLACAQPQMTRVLSVKRGHPPPGHDARLNEAWDLVSMLKLENAALKERVNVLESAQDDALDAILAGLGTIS